MGRVNNYLVKNFISLFGSLFFTLFFIASVIFFIKISIITSVVKINLLELMMLYMYLLPNILIYTLPITFFVALSITLFNMSKENEIIILFTLGYNPKKIANLFLTISSVFTLLLIIDIFILIPTAKQLNSNFLDYKRVEAKFNIKASEVGQKFSNWLVYIDKNDKKESFNGVVMFQEDKIKNEQQIITAKRANIKNDKGSLKLKLDDGKAFQISDTKIEQVNFKEMLINTQPKNNISNIKDIITYWSEALHNKKRANDLSFFLLIALFPLASVFFALSFGIVTYRYAKNGLYPSIIMVIVAYMTPGILLIKYANLLAVASIFIVSIVVSFLLYKRKILARY